MPNGVVLATSVLLACGVGLAQPPEPKNAPEPFTAFPNLKPLNAEKGKLNLLQPLRGYPKPIPAKAAPLTQVRIAQVNHGAAYLRAMQEVIALGRWDPNEYEELNKIAIEVYRIAADVEPNGAAKITLYQERVILMKTLEEFFRARVEAGSDPPQRLHKSRMYRLQAEAELLQLLEATPGNKK